MNLHKQDEYGEYERYKKILENSPHGLATLREHHLGHKAIDQLAQEQLSNEDFGGERKRIHVINWWDREHQMHPYNNWERSGKRTRQTNKPYNPDAQIGLWDFHRNYLEDFVDYHNDQQKPGKIGGAAWDRYQNMYADVGEGAHPATSDLNNLKRVTQRMMQQGIYNPHDVEDVPEDFPQYKSVQKLMNFVQIQKIGYPDPQESYPKGFNMEQSSGLPSPESKDGQKVGEIARKMQPDDYYQDRSPLHAAHSYIRFLQDDMGGHPGRTGGSNTHPDIGMHLAGHQAIATVHNILNFGEDYLNHPDAINYRRYVPNPDYGRGSTQQYLEEPQLSNEYKEEHGGKGMGERMSVEHFHKNLLRANMHPTISHHAAGMADDLHRRIRQVSPAYHPDDITGYNKFQAPGSMETSFAESAPLPPEGEGEGDVSAEEMLLPRGIPYNRGDAFPKDRYGRWYRDTMPNMTPRSSGTSGSTTLHRYPSMRGRRESYKDPDEQLSSQAETIRDYPSQNRSRYAPKPTKDAFERRFPDLYDKEKAVSKLMKFVQKAEEDDGIEGFRRRMGDEIQRQVDKNRPHTEWGDTHPDLFLPVGHKNAPLFLEPEEKGGKGVPSVHYHAYNYVDKIHRDVPMTANQHADGLKRVHRSDMLQRRGDAVRDMDYDDAFPLGRAMPKIPPRNAPKGQRPSQEYLDTTRKEMNIHDFLTDHTESMLSKVPSQHQEGIQRMFKKVAFESPSYKPTGSFETDPDIQQYFAIEQSLRKEGDGGGDGGAFNGLNGTVFTSTNAGIFTPTYGGDRTRRKHEKRHNKQERKRKKLLGKEKKSGVDRLIQYLYDGSPIAKAGKKGLAPGLDADMTGDGATAHAWNNKATGRKILDWQKVAENNEPHVNMGMAGGMEAGVAAAYPQEEDPSVNNATTPRKAEWKNGAYVQKAANQATTMISPTENQSADGPHPQQAYVERTKDNPNEAPAKDAVLKENDMQRKVKKYDDKASRRDGGQEQPAGSMAAAGMGGYPSGAAMQMSSFGMNTYEQDSLARGGEEDEGHDEEDIDDNERDLMWVPEAEKVAKLEAMRKELEAEGDATPLLTALLKVDYASSK